MKRVEKSGITLIVFSDACKRLIRFARKSSTYSRYLKRAYEILGSKGYCFRKDYRGTFPLYDTVTSDGTVYYAVWRLAEEFILQLYYADVSIRSDCAALIVDAIPALFYVRIMQICKAGVDDGTHTYVFRERMSMCYRLCVPTDYTRRMRRISRYFDDVLTEVLSVITPYCSG